MFEYEQTRIAFVCKQIGSDTFQKRIPSNYLRSNRTNNFVLDSKPHRSERKRKSRLAAKSALDLSPKDISIPYTDLKLIISKFLHKKWQQRWDMNINNKLFQIQPNLGEWRPAF